MKTTFAVCLLILLTWQPMAVWADEAGPRENAPVLAADAAKIDILEAVRLTLAHDPNLRLQEEDAAFQEGVYEETLERFDWTFTGDLSYNHDERALSDGVLESQRERRENLADFNEEACDAIGTEQARITELEAAQAARPGEASIAGDDIVDSQLRLLDELIETAENEGNQAVAQDLSETRFNLLQAEIDLSQQLLAGAQQACTISAEDLARLGGVPEFEEFDRLRLDLRAEKLFTTGLFFSPFIQGDYDSTQFVGKRNGEEDADGRFLDFGGKNVEDLYATRVGFDVNIPLMRGRGADEVAAATYAAQSDLGGTRSLVQHEASRRVLETAAAYWSLLAAQERARIAETSVELQKELGDAVRQLIQGDELPSYEEARVDASLANAMAQLERSLDDVIRLQAQLADVMGVGLNEAANAPSATDSFPTAPSSDEIKALSISDLVEQAVEQRYDVAAARQLIESGRYVAQAAALGVRSRLDVSASAWTSARGETSFSEATDRWVTPSWRVGLAFEKPFKNQALVGRQEQSEAVSRQNEISARDLERNVRLGVILAIRSLAKARERLAMAEEAAEAYRETVVAELERFRQGESTLVDTILTEQDATSSYLALAQARAEVATLVVQLRFELGALITDNAGRESQVTRNALTVLP